ncbi:glycoside hydrolase family 32 protein [uncultured Vibrio sp.]|uniref:glycoside hydrolase family 32 protein n=1 Tax=uncultured Vibrio sp. TaxID=114054 RepID=UPI0029C8C9CF|nr:glycoside hydrolase family 32 protein [uncultured Vibrio sp.]
MPNLDKYKPSMHFSPAFGWINDPNGLVYSNGSWHLFYQFHPMNTVWGPMHWGHAVSTDLVNWNHYPIAIAPDKLGHMFSGSAIVDKSNASGLFQQESEANLIAYYTASMPRHDICPEDLQTQCLAYSQDGGFTWSKYENNPILPNPDLLCYRDPKVIWVEDTKHWVMVLTHGQSVGIYKSHNLIDWEYCSEFGENEGYHSQGPWECPDLFPLTSESGVTKWVMVVGIGPHDTDGDYGQTPCTQYFVGDFDGEVFTNSNPSHGVTWLDNGCDYYATQSYFNAPNGARVSLSWMSNWNYARNTETNNFRGIMTLPREFKLVENTSGSYVVAQRFFFNGTDHFTKPVNFSNFAHIETNSSVYALRANLHCDLNETVGLTLFGLDAAIFEFKRVADGYEIRSIRHYYGDQEVMKKEFQHDFKVHHACCSEMITMELIVDHGAVELLLNDGKFSLTQLYFPQDPDGNISLVGNGWENVVINNQMISNK